MLCPYLRELGLLSANEIDTPLPLPLIIPDDTDHGAEPDLELPGHALIS
jgi:hypothetical protein